VQGDHRNVFIEDGMVVFVTQYHKGYNVSGDVKIIHRYLPCEVGKLVVWYLWLVLPFQQRLEALVWEKEAVSSYMWPANPNSPVSECQIQRRTRWFIEIKGSLNKGIPNDQSHLNIRSLQHQIRNAFHQYFNLTIVRS
jgi:hypothetical protein